MESYRKYGDPPFTVGIIHGGPGARGDVAPVAEKLSQHHGILEPYQNAYEISSLIDELKSILFKETTLPLTLIGHSWGAWLCILFTASHPEYVKKIILISSGPFEEKYAAHIMKTRLDRLCPLDVKKFYKLQENLNVEKKENNAVFAQLGRLLDKADSFDPIEQVENKIASDYAAYRSIWPKAHQLRQSGRLLEIVKKINCPVVAIHGDFDPHPFEGVKIPLAEMMPNFKFFLLSKCGHKPWIEKKVREKFFEILENEI